MTQRPPQTPEPKEEDSTHLAVPGVYFTCPLTGATLRKDQREAAIKEAILSVSAPVLRVGGTTSRKPTRVAQPPDCCSYPGLVLNA